MDAVDIISDWATAKRVFRRNRTLPRTRVLAAALCSAGLSFRTSAAALGQISHVAVRDSYLNLTRSLPREKSFRREVALDGGRERVGQRDVLLWLARDVDSGEVLSFQGSLEGSPSDSARFLASVTQLCENRPRVRVASGRNFPKGLINLDLYFQSTTPPSLLSKIGRILRGERLANIEAAQTSQ